MEIEKVLRILKGAIRGDKDIQLEKTDVYMTDDEWADFANTIIDIIEKSN